MRNLILSAMATLALAGCQDRMTPRPGPAPHAAASLDPVSSPTNLGAAAVSGTALPWSAVSITGGASAVQATADSGGRFAASVPLNTTAGAETQNDLVVYYTSAGRQSAPAFARIVHDPMAPFPAYVTSNPSPTSSNPATFSGSAEADARVTVYGGQAVAWARADAAGAFSISVSLFPDSLNALSVVVTDAAGNTSAATQVQIVHDSTPPAAAAQSLLRAYHDGVRLVVEGNFGCVEPDAAVQVEDITALNPAAAATATGLGDFKAVIAYGANGNTIRVTVTDTAGNASLPPHTTVSASLSWSAPAVAGTPAAARVFGAAAYDFPNDRVFIFGGRDALGALNSGAFATITPGSETWAALAAASAPSPRCGHSVSFDGFGKMYVFGGMDPAGPSYLQDVHSLDVTTPGAETWMPVPAASPPPARAFHAAAFDPSTGKLIVFGGEGAFGPLSDLWQFTAWPVPAWTQLAPSGAAPPALAGASAVMDPNGPKFVLFGGRDAFGQRSNQVRVLDLSGTPAWTLVSATGTAPAARDNACLAFDSIGSRLFLFGGNTGASRASDLYVFDLAGSFWSKASPGGLSPAAREGACMAFDLRRLREVVFGGGSDGASGSLYADLLSLE